MSKTDNRDRDALRPISYFVKRDDEFPSDPTMRRYLRAGRLPRRKIDGKYYFTINEVVAAQVPVRKMQEDERLIEWAKVQAAGAGPMTPEQIDVVVNAFRDSLQVEVARS